eukprot:249865-Hanusia_phi.AAC.1
MALVYYITQEELTYAARLSIDQLIPWLERKLHWNAQASRSIDDFINNEVQLLRLLPTGHSLSQTSQERLYDWVETKLTRVTTQYNSECVSHDNYIKAKVQLLSYLPYDHEICNREEHRDVHNQLNQQGISDATINLVSMMESSLNLN